VLAREEAAMSISFHDVERLQAFYPDHKLEEKIALFLRQGVQVSLLIDPDKRTVRTYRSSSLRKDAEGEEVIFPITILQDGDTLTIPDLFPGWELPITSLWPPVYE
jgi:Uma2 family endonuclease